MSDIKSITALAFHQKLKKETRDAKLRVAFSAFARNSRGGNVVGMISTHWCTPHEPSENDLRPFDALAAKAAELIESCRPDGDWL